jgi:rhamnosyltransferase
MVKEYNCPFVKRKNFTIDYENFVYFSLGNNTRKAFDYISKNALYDVNMIWEHILRTGSYRNIKDNMHLNYVLPEKYLLTETVSIENVKVALFAHITYEDQIEYCMEYMNSVSDIADVYITTLSPHMVKCMNDRFGQSEWKHLKIILLPENSKGRDVGALWVGLRQYMENYDYICFIHNKKSPQTRPLTVGRGFSEKCMTNTIASREYVINLLSLFERSPRLGMLFPPPVLHGPYMRLISGLWGGNYKNTVALAERLGINVSIDNYIDPIFPAGGMFWFRPSALGKVKEHEWKYEDFPDEPLKGDGTLGHAFERIYCFAAQSNGYYSAWVMTDEFAPVEITSMARMLSIRQHATFALLRQDFINWLRGYPKTFLFFRRIFRFFKRTLRRIKGT